MIVTLEEMKQYLRVDYEDDDSLIVYLMQSAKDRKSTRLNSSH